MGTINSRLGCLGLLLLASVGGAARAADALTGAADAAVVQPLLVETTVLVFKVDPVRLAAPDLSGLTKGVGLAGEAHRQRAEELAKGIEAFRTASGGRPLYASVGIPLSKAEWPVFVFSRESSEVNWKQLVELVSPGGKQVSLSTHDGLAVAMPSGAASLDGLVPSPRKGIDDAFRAVAQYPVQVLLLPPEHVRRTIVELMPQLPRRWGGGPSEVLTEGLLWAALGLDPGQLHAELVIQSASAEAARRLADQIPRMFEAAYNGLPEFQRHVPREAFQALTALLLPKAEGDRVVLRLEKLQPPGKGSLQLAAIVATVLQDRVRREANSERFKQILLAMHNYHAANQSFPPTDKDRDGKGNALLSWRVHLLPFLDEGALYREFHLNEPWDSPHNQKLIQRMPKVYQSRWFGNPSGRTTFLAPVGEDTVFGGRKATRFQSIVDGTVNTVVLVEVKPELAVPWTAPQDYGFDPAAPARGLNVLDDGRFLAGFADGSVRPLRGDIQPQTLVYLFRMSDGRPIDPQSLR